MTYVFIMAPNISVVVFVGSKNFTFVALSLSFIETYKVIIPWNKIFSQILPNLVYIFMCISINLSSGIPFIYKRTVQTHF